MSKQKEVLGKAFEAHRKGQLKEAENLYKSLIDGGFKHESVLNNLSAIWTDRGEYAQAIDLLLSSPNVENSAQLQSTLAAVYKYKGDLGNAIRHANRALEINADLPDTWNNLGSSLRAVGHWEDAILALNEAVARQPKFALALYNLGNAYLEKRDLKTAIHYYDRALDADSGYASAHVNRGNCYRELRDYHEAEKSYVKGFELNPDLIETQFNLGVIYMEQQRFTDAISCFSKTITTEEYGIQSLPHIIGATQKICDWTYSKELKRMAETAIRSGTYREAPPFNLIAISDDPDILFRANEQYTVSHIKPPVVSTPGITPQARIKIAYFSNDIHDHATGYLIAELFELHDFERFDITLISYGPDAKNSELRNRIKNSKVKFIEASLWSNPKIIEFIQSESIQILIDLKGYTAGCRPQILAARPAPIQIQYLGYPATMGCEFIDYFVGDHITLPDGIDSYFSESLIRMNGCYQINDSKRRISDTTVTREQEGLPEDAFVFTSFNSTYKITEDLWNVWMSILKVCDNAVLWMIGDNEWARINLIEHARNLGVAESRIVFAEKKPQDEHLARLRLGDLALDTYPCCGHTTTSDALYAELPVLTLLGKSFHSRVSASLLCAQGLEELVTKSIGDYATTAVTIASSEDAARNLRERTIDAKKTGALFNTPGWVREFEDHLITIYESRLITH
jgi:protein O-GlcNAc transferase